MPVRARSSSLPLFFAVLASSPSRPPPRSFLGCLGVRAAASSAIASHPSVPRAVPRGLGFASTTRPTDRRASDQRVISTTPFIIIRELARCLVLASKAAEFPSPYLCARVIGGNRSRRARETSFRRGCCCCCKQERQAQIERDFVRLSRFRQHHAYTRTHTIVRATHPHPHPRVLDCTSILSRARVLWLLGLGLDSVFSPTLFALTTFGHSSTTSTTRTPQELLHPIVSTRLRS